MTALFERFRSAQEAMCDLVENPIAIELGAPERSTIERLAHGLDEQERARVLLALARLAADAEGDAESWRLVRLSAIRATST